MTTDREERIKAYHPWHVWKLFERIIDLEDSLSLLETNHAYLIRVNERLSPNNLDPDRLESALRMYVSELDYDIHKNLECGEEDGLDHYKEEVDYFLRCWETAGEN